MVDEIVGKKGTKRKVRFVSSDKDKDELEDGPRRRLKREEEDQAEKAREIGRRQTEDLLCEYLPSPLPHPPPPSSLSPPPSTGEPPPPPFPSPFVDPRVDCHVVPVLGT